MICCIQVVPHLGYVAITTSPKQKSMFDLQSNTLCQVQSLFTSMKDIAITDVMNDGRWNSGRKGG